MKRWFELPVFLFSSFIGIAQNNSLPVYEIKTATIEYEDLPNTYGNAERQDGKLESEFVIFFPT